MPEYLKIDLAVAKNRGLGNSPGNMALSVPMVSSTTVDDDGSVGKRTRKGRTKTDAQAGKVRYKLFLLIV